MRKAAYIGLFLLTAAALSAQQYDTSGRLKTSCEVTNADADVIGTVIANVGTGTQPVSGTLTCDVGVGTQPVSGTVTVTATNLDVQIGGSDTVTVTATDLDIRNLTAVDTVTVTDGLGALNVIVDSGSITASDPTFTDATGTSVPANAAFVAGTDGTLTRALKTDAGGELQVDVLSSALPSGAATSANQLPDGHNVTVDNAAGAAAVNIQDGGNIITVDGTVTVGTFPDNEPFNLAQVAGAAVQTGNGAAAGAQRVSLANDSTGVIATVTTVTNLSNLPNENQQTAANSISVTPDTDNDAIGAQGAAPPGEYVAIGGVTSGATGGFLNGIPVCTEFVAVDIVTATTTLVITGVAGRHVYICSINLVTAAANNVAIVAGTGATCGTSTAGLNGGTTAAEGWNFAANGGLAQGAGLGAIMSTLASGGATGDSVCITTSAATQLSGTIGYAIY